MKSLATVALGLGLALVGCQNNDSAAKVTPPPPPAAPATTRVDEPYKNDVRKVCNVVELAGATEHASNDRAFLVATYLGKSLETGDAQKWLASIQRLNGNAKADALEQEARRVGLEGCPLAADWRSPPPP